MSATTKLLLIIMVQLVAPSVLAESGSEGTNSELGGRGSFGLISASSMLNPTLAKTYTEQSPARDNADEYDSARKIDGGEALAPNSKLAEFYYHQGNAYYYLNDYHSAIANYNEAIGLRPNYADAYYHRALAYIEKGLSKKALIDFRKALSRSFFSISVYNWNSDARRRIFELELEVSETVEVHSEMQASESIADETQLK